LTPRGHFSLQDICPERRLRDEGRTEHLQAIYKRARCGPWRCPRYEPLSRTPFVRRCWLGVPSAQLTGYRGSPAAGLTRRYLYERGSAKVSLDRLSGPLQVQLEQAQERAKFFKAVIDPLTKAYGGRLHSNLQPRATASIAKNANARCSAPGVHGRLIPAFFYRSECQRKSGRAGVTPPAEVGALRGVLAGL
jgi:hypothetical protein